MKEADLRDMFRKASMSACTSTVVVFPDPLSPIPSASSNMETPQYTKEDPADERDILVEYSSDYLYRQV
jgi:hypothetical protein